MRSKLKVLFLQSQSYMGADSLIHSLLMRNYDRERVEVHVACNSGAKTHKSDSLTALETIPDLHVRPTDFGPTINMRSKWNLARDAINGLPTIGSLASLAVYIKKNHIDVIHGTEKPRDAFYGVILGKITGAKSLVHMHIKCTNQHSPLLKWALRHADGIVGISDYVTESVIAMGYAADKVHTVLNSLDMQGWDCALDGSAVRAEFGIAPEDPLLATVSRLFSWKGHTELLKALAIVHQRVSNVRLLIVGEDDPRAHPRQGAYSVELKALARELGLSDAVIFAGHRKDVPRILAACDVYAMPSFEEPFGMVFLEAMAMKKPVVALNNGGTPEVVQHGQSGLLSQPYVIEELAANILTLLHNPDLRRFMGERGRMRVAESFNPRRMATDCERIYWQLKGRSVPVSESQATRSLQGG